MDNPSLQLSYEPDTQSVGIEFDNKQLKHWSMVRMVLTEAMQIADGQISLAVAQARQQQLMQMVQDKAIRNQLKLG